MTNDARVHRRKGHSNDGFGLLSSKTNPPCSCPGKVGYRFSEKDMRQRMNQGVSPFNPIGMRAGRSQLVGKPGVEGMRSDAQVGGKAIVNESSGRARSE